MSLKLGPKILLLVSVPLVFILIRTALVGYDLLNVTAMLAFVLTLAVMLVFARGTVRRITELGEKAQRIAEGKALGPPANSNLNDEIARADRALHAMADTVAERQETLTRYKLLAENARDIILFLRRSDARILEANEAAVAAYGYSRSELLSLTAADLRVPEERLKLAKHLESSDHGPVFYESRHLRQDGSSFPVEVTGQSAYIRGERVLMTIVRDVTDRKHAEEERDSFFEASIDMLCVASFGGYFTRLNAAWERTLGFTRRELMAIPFVELIHPDDVEATATAMRTLTDGRSVIGFENRYRRKDGEYVWFSWNAFPSPEEGFIYAVARDVSERRQRDEELARSRDQANEASRIKSEFLANMSHEIRTPMNGIIGTTGLLRSMALTAEQREYVNIINESGEALLTIINQILDLSKLEAGKLALDAVDFSPVAVVENVAMLFASAARQKNLSIQSYIAPDVPPSLRGDAGQLRQILVNLTGNAIKFTDSGGIVLRVASGAAGDSDVVLRFSVSDTGIGIAKDTLANLFVPFTQADSSTTRKYGGSGLGLSISKRLVELMRGEIGVEANEDCGTTFWFTARFDRPPEKIASTESRPFSGIRVLVVDPDPVSNKVLHQYLFNWGMRNGMTATTCTEALDMLCAAATAGDSYDLAFIDAGLARAQDGIFARTVAADPLLSRTRLILLKPIAADSFDGESLPGRFSCFLSKPIRQSYLFDSIAAALHIAGDASVPAPHPVAAATERETNPAVPNRKILVAEDNEINRRLAAAQFKRLGYEADFVENGRQAVEAVAKGTYAVVFMDCHMPEMDGFEASRAIRKSELRSGSHIPIIAMTANAMEGDRERCVAQGMDDYVAKPVDLERLRLVIDRWLLPGGGGGAPQPNGSRDPREDAPPLDLSRLREFFGDDDEALRSLLHAAVEESQSVYGRLRRALNVRDAYSALQAAHELKGFAANVGAGRVATLAADIEGRVAANSWGGAQEESAELDGAIERMVSFALETMSNGGSPRRDS